MMKKNYLLILALLIGTIQMKAQLPTGSYADYFKEGSFLLQEENYEQALKNFLQAWKQDSSSANINYNVGYCFLKSTKKNQAEKYLAKAITDIDKNYRESDPTEKGAPPTAFLYYAKSLHLNYKFDEAAVQYDTFEKLYARDKTMKELVANDKIQNVYAKEQVAAPINVKIENLGDSINSEYPDFSPTLSADERMIIYTTRRNTSTGQLKAIDGQYYEDIVVAYKDDNNKWSSPKPISSFINTSGNEASINLTPDGQTLIVYQDIGKGGGDVFYSTWDGKDWSSLQSFGSDVNSPYWETHACLSADNNTLYFVSNRPGGYGGRDIYKCTKLPNGQWGLAVNAGPIVNTKYDEDGPFLHPDGITLMFASNRSKSMGGFDIFFTTIEDGVFSEPINMGYPINTPDDDVFFVTSPDGKRGYFSSANDKGFGEKDIYMMYIPDAKEKPLALFKGSIIPSTGEALPENLEIIVTDKESGQIVGRYKPKENGTFATIIPPNKNYTFSYTNNGDEFYSEDLYVSNEVAYQEIKKEINLEPVTLLGKVKVKEKTVTLTTIVLNNSKERKPVPNAKVTLTQKKGAIVSFDTDSQGRKEGTPLEFEKLYSIMAESNGKKSVSDSFHTFKIAGSKIITQTIFMEPKPAKTFDLILNVLVVNTHQKPLPDSKVYVTGNDGSKFEGVTDAKGRLKNIEILKDVNYDLVAENNGTFSEKQLFTTMNVTARKTYDKTLVLNVEPLTSQGKTPKTQETKEPVTKEPVAKTPKTKFNPNDRTESNHGNVGCGSPVNYKYYFAYNKVEAEEASEWNALIDAIVSKTKECNPVVKVLSSASQVPTYSFASNQELAESRASHLEAKIKAAVQAKGGDAGKIEFKKIAQVRGPAYAADFEDTEKYGIYQYVKVIAR